MNPTAKTIRFLRTLTLDGVLTSEEIWSLAGFFNEQPECRTTWPGEILAPMLESAYDDGHLTSEEMALLAETISSVEAEWRSRNPEPLPAEDLRPVRAYPALLPRADGKFEITSPRDDLSFTVLLAEPSCTCPDWQPRKILPQRHPGKCCRHIAHAFARTGKVFEPWFQALLDDCYMHGRGIEPRAHWLLIDLPESKPALAGGALSRWCSVFAPDEEGYSIYSYNPGLARWSYGEAPRGASLIVRAILDNFPQQSATVGI
jgi:hypothetical protein